MASGYDSLLAALSEYKTDQIKTSDIGTGQRGSDIGQTPIPSQQLPDFKSLSYMYASEDEAKKAGVALIDDDFRAATAYFVGLAGNKESPEYELAVLKHGSVFPANAHSLAMDIKKSRGFIRALANPLLNIGKKPFGADKSALYQ